MKHLMNKNGQYNKHVQILIDGLEGPNYYDYVDLFNSIINDYLENWDDLCYYPNNDDALQIAIDNANGELTYLFSFIQDSGYDRYADFVNPAYLTTMDYQELRALYLNEVLTPEHYEAVCNAIEEIQDELEDLTN